MNEIIRHAQQTFLAMKNPYHSVERVYPQAIHTVENKEKVYYVGIKNVVQIPIELIRKLKVHGYELHTIDRCSINGRAIDMQLRNPITGNPMTGSSSGTAINVFLGINDLGIGTDGGGSVLAPAMSLQCYGFISPKLEQEHMKKYKRDSTDGLCFTPSLGFISRDLSVIKKAAEICLNLKENNAPVQILYQKTIKEKLKQLGQVAEKADIKADSLVFPVFDNRRDPMIDFLRKNLPKCDVLIGYEKKIDVNGMGDSIFGHFDEETQAKQLKSGKFFVRAVNMAGATALCIPDTALASGYVLICESKTEKIEKLFQIAEKFPMVRDELADRYFRNADVYFSYGALEEGLLGE